MTWVLVIYYMVGIHSIVQRMDVHDKNNCEALKKEWVATAPHVGDYLNAMTAYCVQEIKPAYQLPEKIEKEKFNTQDGV